MGDEEITIPDTDVIFHKNIRTSPHTLCYWGLFFISQSLSEARKIKKQAIATPTTIMIFFIYFPLFYWDIDQQWVF